MMEETSLLFLPEGLQIEQIHITETGLVIEVVATTPTSCCPSCSEPSSSIHCHYRRTLRDVPCGGRPVQLLLTVRKFSCRNPYCDRKVFAERLPAFVEPWARATIRFYQQITSIGLATSGKGGTRLAARLGIQTTRQTILRHIMALPDSSAGVILFLRRPEKLRVEEQEMLAKLRQIHPEVDLAYDLIQQFARMLRNRTGEKLDAWLTQVASSNLPELQSFAAGIEKDKDAVRAGLTWWINNGVVEGHVTKLKLIKRQGYGRAGFPLLRKRLLHAL
jgi:transposase